MFPRCFAYWLRLLVLLTITSFPVFADHSVLLIHSYHSEHGWTRFLKQGFDEALSMDEDTQIHHEYLDAKRYPGGEYRQVFLDYLKQKYRLLDLEVIVVSDDPAFNLIKQHRADFFPEVPLVYLGINKVDQAVIDTPGMTGVFENRDLTQTAIDISRISGSDSLVVVSDSSSTGRANFSKILQAQETEGGPSELIVFEDLRDDEVIKSFSEVDSHVPVFLIGQLVASERNNALISWNGGVELLYKWIPNPLFTIAITTIDHGAVGAHELSGVEHAKQASGLINRILHGDPVDNIEPITLVESIWYFDALKLGAHRLNVDKLPGDVVLLNQEPSFYQKYRLMVWLVSTVFVVAVVVIILLIEIIRRGNRNRKILVENEHRYRDLALAGANIFWETSIDNRVSYLSGDTRQPFGLTVDSILGKTFSELVKGRSSVDFPLRRLEHHLAHRSAFHHLLFKVRFDENDLRIYTLVGKPVYNSSREYMGFRGITKEITQEYLLSEKVAYQANFDSLTGLFNRNFFNEKLADYVNQQFNEGDHAFVCFLDLDRFKLVNDTVGHLIGDAMLAEVATVIKGCVTDADVLGRLGGDEFGLLQIGKDAKQAMACCELIVKRVGDYKFQWQQRHFDVGVSIGMVQVSSQLNETELLSKADLSCYKAKERGREQVYLADPDNDELYNDQLQMGYIANIGQALQQGKFYLAKQVIVPLQEQGAGQARCEILLRYRDEHGTEVSPAVFVPAAEKHGVIKLIDKWVLKSVFENYFNFFPDGNTVVSINLSGISLTNEDLVEEVRELLAESGVNPANICFEITETAAISHISKALSFIGQMKKLGIRFALDDFGSGTSSFGYLKQLPVDYLKIDGSLVRNIVTEPSDRAIVESIHAIARLMNMQTTAEFVENQEIEAILREIGVDYAQGYGLGRPEPCVAQAK